MLKTLLLVTPLLFSSTLWAALKVGTYNIRNFGIAREAHPATNLAELKSIFTELATDLWGVSEIRNDRLLGEFLQEHFPHTALALTRCGGGLRHKLGFIYDTTKLQLLELREEMEMTNPGGPEACFAYSRPLAVGHFKRRDNGEEFHALQVHLKAGGGPEDFAVRFQQYEIIAARVAKLKSQGHQKILVMGDFNTTGMRARNEDFERFEAMRLSQNMANTSDRIFCSYYSTSARGISYPSQLDHILASPELLKGEDAKAWVHTHCRVARCRTSDPLQLGVSYQEVSDHCPQTLLLP